MIQHLLLTPEIKKAMPDTITEQHNFGNIKVIFPAVDGSDEEDLILSGDNAVVEGDKDEIIKWLKPFDGVPVGDGFPQGERFTIMHIKDDV
jgi:hypothetical protein